MPLNTNLSSDGNTITINISGRFDFNLYKEFRGAYEKGIGRGTSFILDFKNTDYIDSSALGMLLVLREQIGGDASKVKIINCNGDIKKILSISNFDKLFSIS